MKEIQLTQGKVAQMDNEDYPIVARIDWHAIYILGKWYAATDWNRSIIYLHKLVLGRKQGEVDHIDGNGLNCQKSNLRPCTHKQNMANRKMHKNNTIGVKWVYFTKRTRNPFSARVAGHYLGVFPTMESAHEVAKTKAKELFGDYLPRFSDDAAKNTPALSDNKKRRQPIVAAPRT